MKALKYSSRDEWLAARRGKITGSRLRDIIVKRGNGRKIGFYELIAERLGIPPEEDENPMERGLRLEKEALDRFSKTSGKKVKSELVLWTREDNESIAVSPDGIIGPSQAVEVKCLSSARHIQAYITGKIPDEYQDQVLQYFIVNDKLKILYVVFYDPRFAVFKKDGKSLDYFTIEVRRKSLRESIKECLEYQHNVIKEVNEIVNSLTF